MLNCWFDGEKLDSKGCDFGVLSFSLDEISMNALNNVHLLIQQGILRDNVAIYYCMSKLIIRSSWIYKPVRNSLVSNLFSIKKSK